MNSNLIFVFISLGLKLMVRCDDEVWYWDAEIYPNLTMATSAKFCTGYIRNPPTSICDPDIILKRDEAINLDRLIDSTDNNTKCFCDKCPPHKRGLNIKVALVKFVKVSKNVSLDQSVEFFAERTRRKWRYGSQCSNDVLIFFSVLDNKIYISMGARAKNVLPEEDVQKILIETKIHFTSGYYYQGLESIIASLQDLSQMYEPKSAKASLSVGSVALIVIGVCIALIVIVVVGVWLVAKRKKNSLNGSFEFIGSWGRNRNKNRRKSTERSTRVTPKIDPIYKPVHTTDKPDFDDSTLAVKQPVV